MSRAVTLELLRTIYLRALDECSTETLVARTAHLLPTGDVNLVSIGKAAVPLLRALRQRLPRLQETFVVVPSGYGDLAPGEATHAHITSHPDLSDASFAAGDALLDFLRASNRPTVVAISGGGSAAIEHELRPWFSRDELIHVNRILVRGGFPIAEINTARKHLSAIKGGRLAQLLARGSISLLLSDVSPDQPEMIASGPTFADPTTNQDAAAALQRTGDARCAAIAQRLTRSEVPETPKQLDHDAVVIGDNTTLISAAVSLAQAEGITVARFPELNRDVASVARQLFDAAPATGALLVAGGEPTVNVTGSGQGGRTFELAAHVAKLCLSEGVAMRGLFGSSDGVDGNSGAAGIVFETAPLLTNPPAAALIDAGLARSDSFSLAPLLGEAIMTGATGTNLRDLFLLARH